MASYATRQGGTMTWFSNSFPDPYLVSKTRMQCACINDVYSASTISDTISIAKGRYDNINGSIYLFGIHNDEDEGYTNNNTALKIYEYKAYNQDTVVQHLIPCYRKSDNVAGMYDTVNNVFYTNQGTGTFIVGENVTDLSSGIGDNVTNLSSSVGDYVSDTTDSNYGKYRIPVKVSGNNVSDQTYNIYLNSPLQASGDDVDYIDFKNQKVVRKVGTQTEEAIELPSIVTFEDYTRLEVLTEVAPSKVEVEYWGYSGEYYYSLVPKEYKQVEYITIQNDATNGYTNGILTPIKYSEANKIMFKAGVPTGTGTANCLFVAAYTNGAPYAPYISITSSGWNNSGLSASTLSPSSLTSTEFYDGTIREIIVEYTNTNTSQIYFGSWSDSYWSRTINWYSFQILNGETVLIDLIPCYRKSDNVAGMYDTVNDVFYTNQGTGTFIVGEEVD